MVLLRKATQAKELLSWECNAQLAGLNFYVKGTRNDCETFFVEPYINPGHCRLVWLRYLPTPVYELSKFYKLEV